MFQPSLENTSIDKPPCTSEIVVSILDEVGDLANLMEMFYLSREPGLLEILRWLATLSEEARQQLVEFASAGRVDHTVRVERTQPSVIMLKLGPE
jgi:cell division inhibitor SulA